MPEVFYWNWRDEISGAADDRHRQRIASAIEGLAMRLEQTQPQDSPPRRQSQ